MLRNKSKIIMLGDGDGGSTDSTASYALTKLPAEWRTASNSSAKRHDKGANYAFLDGHVKWLKPDQIAQVPPSTKSQFYTFLLK
jgi:prepilin-type processing-associated H-X9-DG protein